VNSKYAHLISAPLAILLASGMLIGGTFYARTLEQKYVHALAPWMTSLSDTGSALQQTAIQQPDLLVVYGSSEMLNERTPYSAYEFFQDYPTGFNVFEIAKAGATSLDIAQDLAALGPELRGRKVVFSFTPTMFHAPEVNLASYYGNFSLLHANALIFSPALSLETKQIAAQRMSEYPATLRNDPVLQFGVQQLACQCWYGPDLDDLAFPLGRLDGWIIRLQDHWAVVNYVWTHPALSPRVRRIGERIDWSKEIAQAVRIERSHSNNNPCGIENNRWKTYYARLLAVPKRPGSADAQFIQSLNDSREWTDFGLVLRVLKELGAQGLILSRPMDGPIWGAMGVSWRARRDYYAKLKSAISPYGFPFVDFANHDGDRFFSVDQASHTSRAGWVYVDMTLDAFFHGRIQ